MLMVITPTRAQRASKVVMVLAGVNYLNMLSKYHLAGQKKQYRLQIWEALRYETHALYCLHLQCIAAVDIYL